MSVDVGAHRCQQQLVPCDLSSQLGLFRRVTYGEEDGVLVTNTKFRERILNNGIESIINMMLMIKNDLSPISFLKMPAS